MTDQEQDFRYWAFISYSSADTAIAKKLHRRLETYRVPRDLVGRPGRDVPVPAKIFPVFRDREELPLSADLGSSIEDALQVSRYLIVFCSPEAATSRWVNEEIRYFKSLGREDRILALIVDGEPNASDNPDLASLECFPLALRYRVDEEGAITNERTEPIGGDLRKGGDGWTSAFLKCVAGITGLGFDAFARREQTRRRVRQTVAGVSGVLAVAAGLWTWDYNRVKVDDYANRAVRWGVPEGVGRLDRATRDGRSAHYRIETRRNKVRRVLRLNSAGELRADEKDYGSAIREVTYGEDGSVQHIDLRDHNQKLVMRSLFSELVETDEGPVHYIEFKLEHNATLALTTALGGLRAGGAASGTRSDITSFRVLYDGEGRQDTITFHNAYGERRANVNGAFGQRFQYDVDATLPTKNVGLSFAGKPLASVSTSYSSFGDPTEWRYLGPSGEPSLNTDTRYHGVTQVLDTHGNVTDVAYFGIDGEPASDWSGMKPYSSITRTFDDHGNEVESRYFDIDGESTIYDRDYHKVTRVFDDHGNATEIAYFGLDGEPALDRGEGYHRYTQAFDDRGNVLQKAYYGLVGESALSRKSYHKETQAFDKRGNIVEQTYYGVDGEPAWRHTEFKDFHIAKSMFDFRNNPTETSYYGLDKEPALHGYSGVHKKTRVFDARGNEVEQAFFDVAGEPVLNRSRYHKKIKVFDDRGQVTKVTYFGVAGKPVLGRAGVDNYHMAMWIFDDHGNRTEWAVFGVDGKPILGRGGYHREKRVFDDRGNEVETAYFGLAEEPIMSRDSYHRVKRQLNEVGFPIQEAYFGIDGRPTSHRYGFHLSRTVVNSDLSELDISIWGVDGEAVENREGAHRITIKGDFGIRSKTVTEAFDLNGNPVEL